MKHCSIFTADLGSGLREGNDYSCVCLFSSGPNVPTTWICSNLFTWDPLPFSWSQPLQTCQTCSVGPQLTGTPKHVQICSLNINDWFGKWAVGIWLKCPLVLLMSVYFVYWELLPNAREGNVFRGICYSVHRRSLHSSSGWRPPPLDAYTPGWRPSWMEIFPGWRAFWMETLLCMGDSPAERTWDQTGSDIMHPWKEHGTRQWVTSYWRLVVATVAFGTHPTGMGSCFIVYHGIKYWYIHNQIPQSFSDTVLDRTLTQLPPLLYFLFLSLFGQDRNKWWSFKQIEERWEIENKNQSYLFL